VSEGQFQVLRGAGFVTALTLALLLHRLRPHANFGTILATWDRLFGTRADNDSATAIETGLPGMDELTLPRVFVLPLRGP
jgi:sterol desaturase/sphingolipid hydroxylase (fatty acid hydroxylase superfamily)